MTGPSYAQLVALGRRVAAAKDEAERGDLIVQTIDHVVALERRLDALERNVGTAASEISSRVIDLEGQIASAETRHDDDLQELLARVRSLEAAAV